MRRIIISDDEYQVISHIQRRNHTEDSFYILDRGNKTIWRDLDNEIFVGFKQGLQWFNDALLEEDINPEEKPILDNLFKRFKINRYGNFSWYN